MTWRELLAWDARAHETEDRRVFRREMGDWLAALHWDWFATWTFRPREHDQEHRLDWCKRALDRYLEELGRRAYSRKAARRGEALYGFVAWERHLSGAWHAHGLVGGVRDLAVWDAIDLAHVRLGIARVFPVEGAREAKYVAKYTAKGPKVFDCFGLWRNTNQLPLFDWAAASSADAERRSVN